VAFAIHVAIPFEIDKTTSSEERVIRGAEQSLNLSSVTVRIVARFTTSRNAAKFRSTGSEARCAYGLRLTKAGSKVSKIALS
jgi:hypothetical protein